VDEMIVRELKSVDIFTDEELRQIDEATRTVLEKTV
jgi:trimethylamine:corrinoid methyltransferase-like protein